MRQLSGDVKLFIVTRLAMYKTPTQVVEAVKAEFDMEITREHVRGYNPEQREVSARWRRVFETTRADFHKRIENIPIANLATRLEWLNDVARIAQRTGNHSVLLSAMRQAAEERGEVYTNRRHISGDLKGGVLAVPVTVDTDEYLRTVAAQQAALPQQAKAAAARATNSAGAAR